MYSQSKRRPGLLVVLEGIDGTGKTTQVESVYNLLEEQQFKGDILLNGIEIHKATDPCSTQLGGAIWRIVKDYENVAPLTETYMFMAGRAQLMEEFVYPKLDNGDIVLLDRYLYSTLAYQIIPNRLTQLGKLLTYGMYKPDITFIFELDFATTFSRINREDIIERRSADYYQKVQKVYYDLLKLYPKECVRVNGAHKREQITRSIVSKIRSELRARKNVETYRATR